MPGEKTAPKQNTPSSDAKARKNPTFPLLPAGSKVLYVERWSSWRAVDDDELQEASAVGILSARRAMDLMSAPIRINVKDIDYFLLNGLQFNTPLAKWPRNAQGLLALIKSGTYSHMVLNGGAGFTSDLVGFAEFLNSLGFDLAILVLFRPITVRYLSGTRLAKRILDMAESQHIPQFDTGILQHTIVKFVKGATVPWSELAKILDVPDPSAISSDPIATTSKRPKGVAEVIEID